MNKHSSHHSRSVRLTPLAACLAIAIAAGSAGSAFAAESQLQDPGHSTPSRIILRHFLHHKDGNAKILHHGTKFAANLKSKISKGRAAFFALHAVPHAIRPATTVGITSCLDDGSTGTLRDVITNAVTGDVIDLSTSGCSTITLLTGVIVTAVDDLTIKGSGPANLKIDGNANDSIINHFGYGTLTIQDITLTNASYGGYFATGGAVFSSGNVAVNNSVLSNNYDYGGYASGGAVWAAANLTISNSVISGNQVVSNKYDGTAGGAYGATGLTITNSTISGNSAAGAPYDSYYAGYGKGGGIMSVVAATISGSTISGNTADYGGGAAFLQGATISADPAVVTNSTISGNTANGLGGAALAGFTLTMQNSTVAFNDAKYVGAGGLYLVDATQLQSTIVSNNTGYAGNGYDPNIAGADTATISGANNLILSSGLATPAGTITVDPNLQALADNSGVATQLHTQTHALIAGSSALNVGNNTAGLAFDQRGTTFARSSGTGPDIGAFELQVPRVAAVVVPVPTLSTWAMGLMVGLFGLLGWRRQKTSPASRTRR
ncbi:IPTL-CTERM sorting domain-containing protein [Pseudolysobacter antarcticus]|uniref:IPTL-CTERM sorting domain-containing protein n=1 Tax=Pseudolysobacter antarcticus TaxID=2511995 RepID=A0A411HHW4_9GAMM|nr:IPTL-CTERM sorting domain-containing protein [Pseudolysobacter antarcticus]QBB70109.1 IPTL-CTERM sorting domain-containing protein [Pseudolysobacter antarcticus]